MRNYMSWFTVACFFVAMLFDIGVWKEVGNLQLYDEEETQENPKENIEMKNIE